MIKALLTLGIAIGGATSIPALYLRPFAEFVNADGKHQCWDSVASDYFVGYGTRFDRQPDILGH